MAVLMEKEELLRYLSLTLVRNKDMSWPEEMSFIANSSKIDRHKGNVRGLGMCWKNLCKLEAGQAIYECQNVYLSLTLPRWHYNTIL